MSLPDDYQDKRYDNKVRALFAAASASSLIDEDEETVTLNLEDWKALEAGLDRELMVGDITRFAEENPAKVFNAAKWLALNPKWMARAKAGEGA